VNLLNLYKHGISINHDIKLNLILSKYDYLTESPINVKSEVNKTELTATTASDSAVVS